MARLTARSAMLTLRPVLTVTVVALLACLSLLCGGSLALRAALNGHPTLIEGASNPQRTSKRTSNESATKGHPTAVTDGDNPGRLMTVRDNDDAAEGGRGPPARASASAAVRRAALLLS